MSWAPGAGQILRFSIELEMCISTFLNPRLTKYQTLLVFTVFFCPKMGKNETKKRQVPNRGKAR